MKCIICKIIFTPKTKKQRSCKIKCLRRYYYLRVLKPRRKVNIEKTQRLWREWYQRNRLRRIFYQKKQDEKKGKAFMIKKSHDIYMRHRKKRITNAVAYMKDHPELSQTIKARRRARKLKNGGNFFLGDWWKIKKKFDYQCLKCGKKEPKIKLTIDHVIPLKLGGRNSKENIQPLCFNCNCSKGVKIMDYRKNSIE